MIFNTNNKDETHAHHSYHRGTIVGFNRLGNMNIISVAIDMESPTDNSKKNNAPSSPYPVSPTGTPNRRPRYQQNIYQDNYGLTFGMAKALEAATEPISVDTSRCRASSSNSSRTYPLLPSWDHYSTNKGL